MTQSENHDEPGAQPAADRSGGRGPLPLAKHDVETPAALKQRENESDTAYLAFLLFAMQNPSDRSQRLTARSLSTAESNIRMWRSKFTWTQRLASSPNVEYICLNLYRRRMDEHVGQTFGDRLRLALDAVLDVAGFASLRRDVQRQRTVQESRLDGQVADKKTDVAVSNKWASPLAENELEQIDPARYMRELADNVRTNHLRPEDLRRQIILIDAVLGLIAQKVKSGELRVRVQDIPALLKARAMLTGTPADLSLLAPQQVQHKHAHVHIVESVRMRDARATRNEGVVLDAMKAEVDDLRVILNAVPDRKEEG